MISGERLLSLIAARWAVGGRSAGLLATSKEDAMDFTLSEAKSLVGRTVTVRPERREEVDFNGLFRFSEQGRIIGISGHETPQGLPEIAVVIQFWFADDNTIPELVIMKKDAFKKFFLVQEA